MAPSSSLVLGGGVDAGADAGAVSFADASVPNHADEYVRLVHLDVYHWSCSRAMALSALQLSRTPE